jgi:arsenite methyltransferase
MVRARYGGIAAAGATRCCEPSPSSGCGPEAASDDRARRMGYSEAELAAIPEGANLGLGCGNPQAIAAMRPGEVVVDLASGAGLGRRRRLAARPGNKCHRRRHDQ